MTNQTDSIFGGCIPWKIGKGPHSPFDGMQEACLLEIACVAAGHTYRRIAKIEDIPQSFSVPISAYAIALNDCMDFMTRQESLTPFKDRFEDTRASAEVEEKRYGRIFEKVFEKYKKWLMTNGGCPKGYHKYRYLVANTRPLPSALFLEHTPYIIGMYRDLVDITLNDTSPCPINTRYEILVSVLDDMLVEAAGSNRPI
jgi:hypothetical protein